VIRFFNEDIGFPKIKRTVLKSWITSVISLHNAKLGQVSIIFVSDKYLLDMNNQYLSHNYHTDIITFDYSECVDNQLSIAGDLFISLDTVKSNSTDFGVSFEHELNRVIIHGILHLLGQNDESDEEFEEMKRKEDRYLKLLYKDL
jgi:rRNA maturation RNase YbeY